MTSSKNHINLQHFTYIVDFPLKAGILSEASLFLPDANWCYSSGNLARSGSDRLVWCENQTIYAVGHVQGKLVPLPISYVG